MTNRFVQIVERTTKSTSVRRNGGLITATKAGYIKIKTQKGKGVKT